MGGQESNEVKSVRFAGGKPVPVALRDEEDRRRVKTLNIRPSSLEKNRLITLISSFWGVAGRSEGEGRGTVRGCETLFHGRCGLADRIRNGRFFSC